MKTQKQSFDQKCCFFYFMKRKQFWCDSCEGAGEGGQHAIFSLRCPTFALYFIFVLFFTLPLYFLFFQIPVEVEKDTCTCAAGWCA